MLFLIIRVVLVILHCVTREQLFKNSKTFVFIFILLGFCLLLNQIFLPQFLLLLQFFLLLFIWVHHEVLLSIFVLDRVPDQLFDHGLPANRTILLLLLQHMTMKLSRCYIVRELRFKLDQCNLVFEARLGSVHLID